MPFLYNQLIFGSGTILRSFKTTRFTYFTQDNDNIIGNTPSINQKRPRPMVVAIVLEVSSWVTTQYKFLEAKCFRHFARTFWKTNMASPKSWFEVADGIFSGEKTVVLGGCKPLRVVSKQSNLNGKSRGQTLRPFILGFPDPVSKTCPTSTWNIPQTQNHQWCIFH